MKHSLTFASAWILIAFTAIYAQADDNTQTSDLAETIEAPQPSEEAEAQTTERAPSLKQILEGPCKNVDRAALESIAITDESGHKHGDLTTRLEDTGARTWQFNQIKDQLIAASKEGNQDRIQCFDEIYSSAINHAVDYWERRKAVCVDGSDDTDGCNYAQKNLNFLEKVNLDYQSGIQVALKECLESCPTQAVAQASACPPAQSGKPNVSLEALLDTTTVAGQCCEIFKEHDSDLAALASDPSTQADFLEKCKALHTGQGAESYSCIWKALTGIVQGLKSQVTSIASLATVGFYTGLISLPYEFAKNPGETASKLVDGLMKSLGIHPAYNDCLGPGQKGRYTCEMLGNLTTQLIAAPALWGKLFQVLSTGAKAGAALSKVASAMAKTKISGAGSALGKGGAAIARGGSKIASKLKSGVAAARSVGALKKTFSALKSTKVTQRALDRIKNARKSAGQRLANATKRKQPSERLAESDEFVAAAKGAKVESAASKAEGVIDAAGDASRAASKGADVANDAAALKNAAAVTEAPVAAAGRVARTKAFVGSTAKSAVEAGKSAVGKTVEAARKAATKAAQASRNAATRAKEAVTRPRGWKKRAAELDAEVAAEASAKQAASVASKANDAAKVASKADDAAQAASKADDAAQAASKADDAAQVASKEAPATQVAKSQRDIDTQIIERPRAAAKNKPAADSAAVKDLKSKNWGDEAVPADSAAVKDLKSKNWGDEAVPREDLIRDLEVPAPKTASQQTAAGGSPSRSGATPNRAASQADDLPGLKDGAGKSQAAKNPTGVEKLAAEHKAARDVLGDLIKKRKNTPAQDLPALEAKIAQQTKEVAARRNELRAYGQATASGGATSAGTGQKLLPARTESAIASEAAAASKTPGMLRRAAGKAATTFRNHPTKSSVILNTIQNVGEQEDRQPSQVSEDTPAEGFTDSPTENPEAPQSTGP